MATRYHAISLETLVLTGCLGTAACLKAEPAPPFALDHRIDGSKVRLADFTRQIVVLDFFASWCAPCRPASAQIETGLQEFYAARNGNPAGKPVRVISINIDQSNRRQTDRFIEQTGVSFVLNDDEGRTLASYGGTGIPYLVVIDGSAATDTEPRFNIVYQHAGFEGVAKLRQIIDGLGAETKTISAQHDELIASSSQQSILQHGPQASTEFLWSSDIVISQTDLAYEQTIATWQWRVAFSYRTFEEEYEPFTPFDAIGFATDLDEQTFAGQAGVEKQIGTVTVSGSGGYYDGFTDYRSVWLDNYYKQQFSAVPLALNGYRDADPKGYNASGGLRWEYLQATGILEARLTYYQDDVAPGYEVDEAALMMGNFRLLRGREELDTWAYYLASENVLNRRMRSLLEVQATDTTAREWRVALQGSLNAALWDRWVLRSQGGFTQENPDFEAWFVGTTLEWEATQALLLSLSGRYYRDTGEITNSRQLSSAAPGLETWQLGLGIRYVWSRASVKLFAGPYFSNYEDIDIGTAPFTNLYKNRDWGLAQAAFSMQF